MVRILLVAMVVAGTAAEAPAQSTSAPHSGGLSPFRGAGFERRGEAGLAVGVRQEGCPVEVAVTAVRPEDRGYVLTLRVENTGDRPVESQTLALLAFATDGTPRGTQKQKLSLRLGPRQGQSVDVLFRTATLAPADRLAVAVQELGGGTAWKVGGRELERHVRAVLWP